MTFHFNDYGKSIEGKWSSSVLVWWRSLSSASDLLAGFLPGLISQLILVWCLGFILSPDKVLVPLGPVCVRFPGGCTCRGCSQWSFLERMECLTVQNSHRIDEISMFDKKDQKSAVPQVSAAGWQQQSPGTPFQGSHTQGRTHKWNSAFGTALENSS